MSAARKNSFVWILALSISALMIDTSVAQNKVRFPFGGKRNSEEQSYELTQKAGPWMILCASFVGPEADADARALCEELDREFRLRPYIYRHKFDFTEMAQKASPSWSAVMPEVVNGEVKPQPAKMRVYHNDEFEEVAVLVGDFPSVEDSRAQQILEKIKYLHPKALGDIKSDPNTNQRMRVWRELTRYITSNPEIKNRGPMRAAFLLPNPVLPDEYFAAQKVDKFVLDLNKRVKHSLLDCPGVFSVRVATYRGDSTFDLNQIQEKDLNHNRLLRLGKPVQDSKLVEAAEHAHKLTTELRKMGIEAYEFHDRHESYVCVGSFDWLSRKDDFDNAIPNPDIVEVIEAFKGDVESYPNLPNALKPKVLPEFRGTEIVFDVQPVPVLVPRADNHTSARR